MGGFTTSSSLIKGKKKKENKRIRWLLEMARSSGVHKLF